MCAHIALNSLYLARSGRPDVLARTVTKWNRSCGKRLARFISYIYHRNTAQTVLVVVWETKTRTANQDCFRMHLSQETCRTQNPLQEELCLCVRTATDVPIPACARSETQFLTAAPSQESFRMTQVYKWNAAQHYYFGTVFLETFAPYYNAGGNLKSQCSQRHSEASFTYSL